MSGKAATFAANYAAKKMLGKEMNKYKDKKPAGGDDPFFELITLPNGKTKKVKKQIPDYIPEHDAKVLERVKSRAYHLDLCLFNFMGIRFGWSAIWGLIPELGDVLDLLMAWSLMRKCGKIEGGLPTQIHMRMVFNLAVDFLVGLVPFVGDLADAAFRCNTKNAALLEEYLMKKYGPKSMSMKEKRQSRLEDLDSDQLQALKDPEKSHSPAGPRRPEPTAQRDRKTGGRWLGGERKREPDVEMGGQHTGRTREV